MGGKDAILVDETADLDAAATGIVAAAFGYQGQKCSACSRAIIVADVYDALLAKIIERAGTIPVGDPAEGPHVDMGPVIERAAMAKHLEYIEVGKAEGRLASAGRRSPPPPAATSSSPPSSPTSRPPAGWRRRRSSGRCWR